tara:strand:+ start:243 stop:521 length:279 start_codon:yes stop_codon:yes gene_type:complete
MGGLVTGLFSTPEVATALPGPDPEMERAQREQDERLEARERQNQKELASRKRARRTGGNRLLLANRDNPFMGVPPQQTLGPTYSRSRAGINV